MFEIINESKIEVKETKELEEFIKTVVKKFQLDQAEFNIVFVNDEYIHELNKKYRNIDRKTDVITFALEDNIDVELEHRVLGDIYISIETAIEQAKEYHHSFKRELSFLTIHGILHLLGYDHIEKQEEEKMFKLQNEILEEAGIRR